MTIPAAIESVKMNLSPNESEVDPLAKLSQVLEARDKTMQDRLESLENSFKEFRGIVENHNYLTKQKFAEVIADVTAVSLPFYTQGPPENHSHRTNMT